MHPGRCVFCHTRVDTSIIAGSETEALCRHMGLFEENGVCDTCLAAKRRIGEACIGCGREYLSGDLFFCNRKQCRELSFLERLKIIGKN